jgi:hypothetical protein
MKILDEYFKLLEGADDAKFRARSIDVHNKLTKALTVDKSKIDVVVNVGILLDDMSMDDLSIEFARRSENEKSKSDAKFVTNINKKEKKIVLFIDVPSKVAEMSDGQWRKILQKGDNVAKIMERTKGLFYHEFVHYMDFARAPGTKKAFANFTSRKRSGTTSKKDYFNDPLESNAIIQQGLTQIEDYLNKVTKNKALKIIGKSPDEFYKLVLDLIPGHKHFNEKYKSKLKKRTASMWTDVMNRFGEKA